MSDTTGYSRLTALNYLQSLLSLVPPTFAAEEISKEDDCAYQADVVGAIQTARMDRVKESNLASAVQQRDYHFGWTHLATQTP